MADFPSNASGQDNPNDWQERERERYRLRIGLRGTFWMIGSSAFAWRRAPARVQRTSRSVTIPRARSPGGGGPFAKGSDGVFVGQAYGGYKGFPGFTFTGGRMPNPFVTTRMVWDEDINPEGLAEQWKHTFTIGGGAAEPVSYSKDGKNVAPPPPAEPLVKIDVFANFGQFVYDDSNPSNPIGPPPTTTQPIGGETQQTPLANAFMLGWQVGAKFDFPHIAYFQLAPTLYNYTGDGNTFNVHFSGDPGTAKIKRVLTVFWFSTSLPRSAGKLGKFPCASLGILPRTSTRTTVPPLRAIQTRAATVTLIKIGLGIGQLKRKRDWQIDAWWQHQDQYALDPNLVDSDLFNASLNLEGVAVRAGYMLADAVVFNLTWAYAWRIDDSIGTGGIGDNININPVDQYQIFQADLSFKF